MEFVTVSRVVGFFFAPDSACKLRVGGCPLAFGADSEIPPDTGKRSGEVKGSTRLSS